ncbi:RHS repeat-associated core domain-containing protein [Hafnia paralvei]|uniref:RHS repeat-associated core domain-containing protein n=1 Tax=Hafnia paralvei TaxID=546367 RepID=UPI00210A11BD|nr:RHS repeat-associated core domain-containing protein [Hafnia paralvei]MCQ4168162.1 DUF6531 domain-containing protein [Hafnia paralvei]
MAKGSSIGGKVIKDVKEGTGLFKTAVEDTKHVEDLKKTAAAAHAKISGHDVQNPERINNMSFNQGYEATHQVLLDEKLPLGGKGGRGPDGQSSQSGGNTTTDGDPVSMMSGEELLTLTDGTLPGWLPFAWQRCYRSSAASQNGNLGFGWRHSLSHSLTFEGEQVLWHDNEHRSTSFPLPHPDAPLVVNVPGASTLSVARHQGSIIVDGYTLTFADGQGQYQFHRAGNTARLIGITDGYGNSLTLFYDKQGRMSSLSDTAHARLAFEYASSTAIHITAVHLQQWDKLQRKWHTRRTLARYEYNSSGELTTVINPLDERESYIYRDDHVISQRQLAGGAQFNWEWEQMGEHLRCVRQWGNFGQLDNRYRWDTEQLLVTVTRADGRQQIYQHNGNARLVYSKSPGGTEQRWQYNDAGHCVGYTDGLGQVTRYFYNDNGQMTHKAEPDQVITQYLWIGGHLFERRRGSGPHQQIWRYQRNAQGDVLKATDPSGLVTTFSYCPQGKTASVTQPDGQVRQFTYDVLGRLTSETHSGGKRAYTYADVSTYPIEVRNETGLITRYQYDPLDRMVLRQQADEKPQRYEYNAYGKVTRFINEQGHQTRYEYAAPLHLLTRKILPNGDTLTYRYDNVHLQVSHITNAKGETYQLNYDPDGRLCEEIGFDNVKTTYQHDANGHLLEKQEFGNQHAEKPFVTTYQRDPQGRLLVKTLPDGHAVTYQYNAQGQLVSVEEGATLLYYEYDPQGRLSAEHQNGHTQRYRYDECGRLIGTLLPDMQWLEYHYENQHLSNITLNQQPLANYRYDPQQRLSEYHQGNGLINRYAYSQHGERTQHKIFHADHPDTLLWEQKHRYSSQGNLQETTGNEARRYVYDALNRLTEVDAPGGATGENNSETYRWDAASNPIYDSGHAENHRTAPGNRLSSFSAKSFEYDRFGNLISESQEKHGGVKWVKRYTYDCQHRLIAAEMPDGNVASYTYDAFNRRLTKTVNGHTTLFIWRGHRLAAQMEGDRENYRNYIYRPGSFEPLAMTRHHSFEYDYYLENRSKDRTLDVKPKPEIYWYQNDRLGTPHSLTNANGQATWKANYLAFGSVKQEASDGTGIDNPLRFAGQYHDRETGLFYNLNRYYDPAMQRYLTQDPLKLAAGLNFYLYVAGNPVINTDPLGLLQGLGNSGSILTNGGTPLSKEQINALPEDQRLKYIQDTVEQLNVSTPENGAVFYSGKGAREDAEIFVQEHGKMTLESTPGGKWLDDLKLFEDGVVGIKRNDALEIWKKTSRRYAENASGISIGILNSPRIESIFNTMEYPALRLNTKITNVITGGK